MSNKMNADKKVRTIRVKDLSVKKEIKGGITCRKAGGTQQEYLVAPDTSADSRGIIAI